MKKIILMLFLALTFFSCEKEKGNNDIIIGKWRLVKGFDVMAGGYYDIATKYQRFEEYTNDNIRIRYDFEGNEITRCNYSVTNSIVTISGKELNGDTWSLQYKYWFQHDTLAIKNDGGFEFYNEYFIRVK